LSAIWFVRELTTPATDVMSTNLECHLPFGVIIIYLPISYYTLANILMADNINKAIYQAERCSALPIKKFANILVG